MGKERDSERANQASAQGTREAHEGAEELQRSLNLTIQFVSHHLLYGVDPRRAKTSREEPENEVPAFPAPDGTVPEASRARN